MADAGVAFVSIVPTMKGGAGKITQELGRGLKKPMSDAGSDAGKSLGKGITSGVDGAKGKLSAAATKVGNIFKTGLKVAGLAGGALLAAGIVSGLNTEKATDKLAAQLGGSEWAEGMGKIAGDLYADAFGNSVAETGDALKKVLQSGLLAEDAGAAEIEALTAKALTFADVLDQDLGMAVQAVDRMLRTGLVGSADEAFDVLTRGMQQGANSSEDLLDTFQEYSTMFRDLGISAEDATGLMIQGLKGGARDADKVADALKELAIRAQDGSKLSAEGFKALGLNADEMTAKFAAGGASAREGLGQVLSGLKAIEDPVARNAAAVALFGAQAEDMGDALFDLDLETAAGRLGVVEGSTDKLGEAYDNASTKIEAFKRKGLQKLTQFIGGTVIPGIERLADVVGPVLQGALETVGPIITQIVDGFTTLKAAFVEGDDFGADGIAGFMAQIGLALREMIPILEAFRKAWSEVSNFIAQNGEIVRGALIGIAVAITAFLVPALIGLVAPMLIAIAPFVLAAAALAALGAGFVWLYQNVEEFRALVDTVLPQIGELFTVTFDLIKTIVTTTVETLQTLWRNWGDEITEVARIAFNLLSGIIQGALDIVIGIIRTVTALIKGDWSEAWEGIKQITSGILTILKTLVRSAMDSIKLWVKIGLKLVKTTFETIWTEIKTFVKNRLDDIIDFFKKLPGRVTSAFSTLASAITSPFSSAFNSIKSLWNRTAGGFGFSIPSWVPGVGGKSFSIPSMHTGGIVPGIGDVPILAQGGEGVFTRDQMAAMGSAPVSQQGPMQVRLIFAPPPGTERHLVELVRKSIRVEGGGNVQVALGGR